MENSASGLHFGVDMSTLEKYVKVAAPSVMIIGCDCMDREEWYFDCPICGEEIVVCYCLHECCIETGTRCDCRLSTKIFGGMVEAGEDRYEKIMRAASKLKKNSFKWKM